VGDNAFFDNVNSTNNTAQYGGSSYISGNNVTVQNCNLNNNSADDRGGGLYVEGNECNFVNTSLSNNRAIEEDSQGGAVFVEGSHNTFTNVTSVNNTADHGGSTYIIGDYTLVENSTIHNNTAIYGGGVNIEGDYSTFVNNNITFNKAIDNSEDPAFTAGGGVVIQTLFGNECNFTKNNISSNYAQDNGGGVFIFSMGGDIYFNQTYAFNNTAQNGGFCHIMMADNVHVSNSTFLNNSAIGDISRDRGEGGAFHISNTEYIEIEGDFANNTATNGSAIYVEDSVLRVYNSTFFDNQAWSYLLNMTPLPKTVFNQGEDITVGVSHKGGDNIANAIHNRNGNSDVKVKNITYPFYSYSFPLPFHPFPFKYSLSNINCPL